MLCLVRSHGHAVELAPLLQLRHGSLIQLQITQRRLVGVASGQGASGEIGVVRGAEEEDAFSRETHYGFSLRCGGGLAHVGISPVAS